MKHMKYYKKPLLKAVGLSAGKPVRTILTRQTNRKICAGTRARI